MTDLYKMLTKRKSMRKFDEELYIEKEELEDICGKITNLVPLDPDINVHIDVVTRDDTDAKWGEYCLLLYSEEKPRWLENAGYLLEQMDLIFADMDIGSCWLGLAKPNEPEENGLTYAIMLAFGKSRPEDFRDDVSRYRRMTAPEIWTGDFDTSAIEAVRVAPSACNSQPWRIVSEAGKITVFRDMDTEAPYVGERIKYFNGIDMGICLCCLEIGLDHAGIEYERKLLPEDGKTSGLSPVAEYAIK